MIVYNCQHSSNCTLKTGGFYLCKSDLNEPRGTFIATKIFNEIRNMAYPWCTLRYISKRNACIHSLEEMHKTTHSSLWYHSPWVPFISRKEQTTAWMKVEEEMMRERTKTGTRTGYILPFTRSSRTGWGVSGLGSHRESSGVWECSKSWSGCQLFSVCICKIPVSYTLNIWTLYWRYVILILQGIHC